jgi:hypothetical protein
MWLLVKDVALGYNQPGEICIRGQQIMKGTTYYAHFMIKVVSDIWC